MHIEPGIVHGAKMAFAFATVAGCTTYAARQAVKDIAESNIGSFAARAAMATMGTFICFQVLPHYQAGVSEVHFIFGTALFLLLGAAPAAIGLALGLLIQGMLFAPTDLPMFAVNATTLLVPMFAMAAVAKRMTKGRAYVDLAYTDVLKMSAMYQGGVVAWVAFWVVYGQGFGAMGDVMTFAASYMVVLLVEPVFDLLALAGVKALKGRAGGLLTARVYNA